MSDPLSNYEMLEELGSGSFGVVYKAREKATGELVAVKHIDLDGTDDDIRDIQQEIALLSTCSSPFVTQYKTSFVRGVKLWIVMEFLGGGSCLDLLKIQPFSEANAAIVCRELLLGLDYLHASGKIHRDIKAANILLSHAGKVKIADFGVAAQLTNIKSQRNTFVGTPFWMAPEVIQEAGYDFKADIWSLGITAMELVQGEPPNADLHPMKALFHIPKNPSPRLDNNRFSRDIRSFVACCLVKDPDKRPSARDLLQHRFIQKAGPQEHLRSLVQKSQQKQHEDERHPRFYEQTMRDMSRREASEEDDWVFDTIRPTTAPQTVQTVKKRKLSETVTPSLDPPVEMLERMDLNCVDEDMTDERPPTREAHTPPPSGTMMRIGRRRSSVATMRKIASPVKVAHSGSPMKASPRKPSAPFDIAVSPSRQPTNSGTPTPSPSKRSVCNKQPLALDMSFGNGQSSVRPFRRVSDESPTSYASSTTLVTNENLPPQPTPVSPNTKESRLGRRIFAKAIDPAFQEVYAQTAGRAQQEALAKAGEAWAALDGLDPEGELALFKLMLEKVQADPKLSRSLLPVQHLPPIPQNQQHQHRQSLQEPMSAPNTPQRQAEKAAGKLILAQNNPHLKSHKRRQSSQISLLSNSSGVEKAQLPGQARPGMEHSKVVGDALYSRWLEGLKSRWPQV